MQNLASFSHPPSKNLCWHACQDAIPTCVNLYKRGIEIDVYCPVCGSGYETPSYIFLDCDFAMDYWRKSPFRFCISSREQNDFDAWCHEILNKLDAEQSGLFITLIWGLWVLRNRWVLEGKRENVGISLVRFVDFWRRYDEAVMAQKTHCKGKAEVVPKWSPPPGDFLKANVDASTGIDSMRGVGVVVRNSKGETMVVACKSFRVDWDVLRSEGVLGGGLPED